MLEICTKSTFSCFKGNRFWKNAFFEKKQYFTIFKDLYRLKRHIEASPMTLNGHMMETDEPVCVLIC